MPKKEEWQHELQKFNELWRDPSFSRNNTMKHNLSAIAVRSFQKTDEIKYKKLFLCVEASKWSDQRFLELVKNIF